MHLFSLLLFISLSQAAPSETIVLGADVDTKTYAGKLADLIYTEAFKRLNLSYELRIFPLKRMEMIVADGVIDGEGGRVFEYGETHKYLTRVEEPLMKFNFSLYGADPDLLIKSASDLAQKKFSVEYLRGNRVCENFIKKAFSAQSLSDLSSTELGIKKLLSKRMDLFCDIDINVQNYLHSGKLSDVEMKKIKKVYAIKSSVPIYPYLLNKHSVLAVKLAKTMKQMHAEGLMEKYRQRVVRELGWGD